MRVPKRLWPPQEQTPPASAQVQVQMQMQMQMQMRPWPAQVRRPL